jgi:hypothetical protein
MSGIYLGGTILGTRGTMSFRVIDPEFGERAMARAAVDTFGDVIESLESWTSLRSGVFGPEL